MTSLPSLATFDPSSSADYRALLGRVPTSVVVISSMVWHGSAGHAVGSFTLVSIEPHPSASSLDVPPPPGRASQRQGGPAPASWLACRRP